MTTPRCRITVTLPHRLLWVHRCVVLRALGLPMPATSELPRPWGKPNVCAADLRTITAEVDGTAVAVEADVRHALWLTLAPRHRGLVSPESPHEDALRIEARDVRREEAQPAPLTRITPQEAA